MPVSLAVAVVIAGALLLFVNARPPENDISCHANSGGRNIFLGGTLLSEVGQRENTYGGTTASFILAAKKMWPEAEKEARSVSGLVHVYLKNPEQMPAYGDELVMKGELAPIRGLRNPGGFDARAYWDRRGVRAAFYGAGKSEFRILRRHSGNVVSQKILELKRILCSKVSAAFGGQEAAFLKALFFGERSDLEEDFKELFIRTGTLHILAVSGFNIGFLSLTVFFILKALRVSRNLKYIVTLGVIWLYCLLVGWQAPVVRASLMATVFILGWLLGRKTDILNTLGLAAALILTFSPKQLFDVGFQLSFLAVFGIAAFVPVFVKRQELLPNEKMTFREKCLQYGRELFWVSFICQVVTLPVTVQNFYIVTPLSLAANLVVVPLSFLIFFCGMIFFLVFAWLPGSWVVAVAPIKILIAIFVKTLFAIEHLPGAYWVVGRLDGVLFWALVSGTAFILWDRRFVRASARAVILSLFLADLFLLQNISRGLHRPFRMTVLDVGQGDSIYFEFPSGGNLLIDAGPGGDPDQGRRVVAPYLKSRGIGRLDALVISHPQEDHIGGVLGLWDQVRLSHVIDAGRPYPNKRYERIKKEAAAKGTPYLRPGKGMNILGFPGVEILVLNPRAEAAPARDINNDSLVLQILYKNTRFLMTGDIGEQAMAGILADGADIRSTVLKVPHHGARLGRAGEAFVAKTHPEVSVISVGGRNPFGHPFPATIGALESIPGNSVFRTDRDGALELGSDGNAVRRFSHIS